MKTEDMPAHVKIRIATTALQMYYSDKPEYKQCREEDEQSETKGKAWLISCTTAAVVEILRITEIPDDLMPANSN